MRPDSVSDNKPQFQPLRLARHLPFYHKTIWSWVMQLSPVQELNHNEKEQEGSQIMRAFLFLYG